MYLPVRVSILIFSPVLMNSGACTVMPVSTVMSFCTLLAESPRMPSGASVTMTFVEDKAVQIELPSSVVLKVTDAPEGVRGDSANNVQKTVTMETGITVQAPLFIKTGEKIKIDTRTGKYMERA